VRMRDRLLSSVRTSSLALLSVLIDALAGPRLGRDSAIELSRSDRREWLVERWCESDSWIEELRSGPDRCEEERRVSSSD
jgi:hypothetical protein